MVDSSAQYSRNSRGIFYHDWDNADSNAGFVRFGSQCLELHTPLAQFTWVCKWLKIPHLPTIPLAGCPVETSGPGRKS